MKNSLLCYGTYREQLNDLWDHTELAYLELSTFEELKKQNSYPPEARVSKRRCSVTTGKRKELQHMLICC